MSIMFTNYQQAWVFLLTWMAYASTYLLRKPLGVIKADMAVDMGLSRTHLGWLDTALLLPYATIQIFAGSSSDIFGPKKTLGFGLVIAGLSMVTFDSQQHAYMMALMLFINGAAQSQAWPSCVKAIGNWFPRKQRTSIFGIWGTCTFAGGVVGTAFAVHLQGRFGWQSVFFFPSMIVGFIGFLVLVTLPSPDNAVDDEDLTHKDKGKIQKDNNLTWLQLRDMPMLKEVAVTTFCVKIVRYCMYMWLPMYLLQQLHYDKHEAGMLSTSFEIGGVLGSAIMGLVINRCFREQQLLGISVVISLSALSFLFFHLTSTWGKTFNVTWMLIAGMCNCGVDPILSGSLAVEIGDTHNAQGSVSGIINGFGSVGTILEGPIIGVIAENYGWSGMLYTMIVLSVAGSVAALKGNHVRRTIKDGLYPKLPR